MGIYPNLSQFMGDPKHNNIADVWSFFLKNCLEKHEHIKTEWGYSRYISAATAEGLLLFFYYRVGLFFSPFHDKIYSSFWALSIVTIIKIIWDWFREKLPSSLDELIKGKFFWD
jgi:hypothetical protein